MKNLVFLLIMVSMNALAQVSERGDTNIVMPKKLFIQDNVQRIIYDYTQSEDLGLIEMHAPAGWTEPIIKAQFEIRGIVSEGTLGLEFENGTKTMTKGQGFFIPKNTLVRIFNAGQDDLILVEVLRPAYKKELVQELSDFTQ